MEFLVILALAFVMIWATLTVGSFLIVTLGLLIVVGILPWWAIVLAILVWGFSLAREDTYQHCKH